MSYALWDHYKDITLSTTTTQSNYQLCFTINRSSGTDSGFTLYVGTDCNANYGDIRFSSDDEGTEYSYFIEPEYTESSARVWVKIPSLSNGLKIRMHYGNVSASSTSSGSNTFVQYLENQTSTYDLGASAVGDAAQCVGHVTLTSDTFDIRVGLRCTSGDMYYKLMGAYSDRRQCIYTDAQGYTTWYDYAYPWIYPGSYLFGIIVTNDDTDFYQNTANIHHVDYGIGTSGNDIGLYSTSITGALVDWTGLAKYSTSVQQPSEILTIDKVRIDNIIEFTPVTTMYCNNTVDISTSIDVTGLNNIRTPQHRPYGYYQYRKITLTNSASTSFDDFQLIFNVYRTTGTDSGFNIYLGTNVKEDYSDVVFTSTNGCTELSHYIINPYTSTSAKILVKIDHIDASASKDIYIYYDNPTATSTSNKDTTVVPALTNSTCESLTGWTRYLNVGYGTGYMNTYELSNLFHPEGNYSIQACASSIFVSHAYVEFGQLATLEIGTPYKLYYDCRLATSYSYSSSHTFTIRVNDSVLKTYNYTSSVTYDKYAEYIQFTPTVESNKISWYIDTLKGYAGSPNSCLWLDNVILIKDITTVSVSSYSDTGYCALIPNAIEIVSDNSMHMPNVVQIDTDIAIALTSTSSSNVAVRNGGFESGDFSEYEYYAYDESYDTVDIWTVCASASHSGNYGAQVEISDNYLAHISREIVIDNHAYLSLWFQMPTCDISGDGYISVDCTLSDEYWSYVATIYEDIITSADAPFSWINATCDTSLYGGIYHIDIDIESHAWHEDGEEMM